MHVTARSIPLATDFSAAQRRLARAGFAIFLLLGAVQALYGPVLPSVRAAFGLSAATAGWTVGAHYVGAVTGVVLSPVLVRRLQARNRVTIGLVLAGAGAPVFAALAVWPWALLGIFSVGLGYGILVVAVNTLFATGFGDRSAALVILVNACFGLGAVLGPMLYGVLSSGNFRPPFFVTGALAALILPLAWLIPESEPHRSRTPARGGPSARGGRALAAFVLLFLLYTAVETDTSGWMATHLVFHGYSQAAAAAFTGAFWAAFTLGRFLSVPVSGRLTPLHMIGGAMVGVIVLAVAARLTPVVYIFIGLLLAPVFPVSFTWMAGALHGRPGAAPMALLGALAGGLIFPVLVGRMIGASSPDVLPLALAAIALAGLLVTVSLPRWLHETPPEAQTVHEGAPAASRSPGWYDS